MATISQIRLVRLLIPDMDEIFGESGDEYILADEDIEGFLILGNGNPKRAAGLAMIAMGNSEAIILKVIKNYETSTNGAALQASWLKSGQELIRQADAELALEWDGGFEIVYPDFTVDYFEGEERPTGAGTHVIPPWGS